MTEKREDSNSGDYLQYQHYQYFGVCNKYTNTARETILWKKTLLIIILLST